MIVAHASARDGMISWQAQQWWCNINDVVVQHQ
jgi:hypothetical protein